MRKSDFVTDMALDALERQSLESLADVKKLQCGIVRKLVKVRDEELARRTGKPKGIYLTYDCPPSALSSEKGFRALDLPRNIPDALLREQCRALAPGITLIDSLSALAAWPDPYNNVSRHPYLC